MNTVQSEMQETGEGDLPSAPPPRGRFPMDTVSGDLAVSSRSHLTLLKDPLSAHGTAIRCYRPILPAPSGGGGRRPRSGRAVGGDRLLAWKDVFSGTPREGDTPPIQPPGSPPYQGDVTITWTTASTRKKRRIRT